MLNRWKEEAMGKWIKRGVVVLVLGFLVFFFVSYPNEFMGILRAFVDLLKNLWHTVWTFITSHLS